MTTDQLRAYLDAHGVDGAPVDVGLHVVESGSLPARVVEIETQGGGIWWGPVAVKSSVVVRHAPLPDFAAMARELAELRANPRSRAPVGAGECPTCRGAGYIDDGRGAGPCSECRGSGRTAP